VDPSGNADTLAAVGNTLSDLDAGSLRQGRILDQDDLLGLLQDTLALISSGLILGSLLSGLLSYLLGLLLQLGSLLDGLLQGSTRDGNIARGLLRISSSDLPDLDVDVVAVGLKSLDSALVRSLDGTVSSIVRALGLVNVSDDYC